MLFLCAYASINHNINTATRWNEQQLSTVIFQKTVDRVIGSHDLRITMRSGFPVPFPDPPLSKLPRFQSDQATRQGGPTLHLTKDQLLRLWCQKLQHTTSEVPCETTPQESRAVLVVQEVPKNQEGFNIMTDKCMSNCWATTFSRILKTKDGSLTQIASGNSCICPLPDKQTKKFFHVHFFTVSIWTLYTHKPWICILILNRKPTKPCNKLF